MAEQQEVEFEEEDGIEVEVVDDTPADDRVSARDREAAADFDISEDEIGQYSDRVQKRIKRLKYEFHEQRRAKETAERQNTEALAHAQRMVSENNDLKNLLKRGNEALYKATEAKTDTELSVAEKEFREAYDAGDSDRIVEAQKMVNEAYYTKRSVEDMRPPAQEAPPGNGQDSPAPQQDYVAPPDPRAIQWLRDNPWFGTQGDEEMTAFAYGVDAKLRKQGVDPAVEPDQYYKVIDERLRAVFPDYFDGVPVREQAPRKSVVAPATRGGKTPRKVTLTSTQMDLAKKLGVTPEQYAQEVAKQETAHG